MGPRDKSNKAEESEDDSNPNIGSKVVNTVEEMEEPEKPRSISVPGLGSNMTEARQQQMGLPQALT